MFLNVLFLIFNVHRALNSIDSMILKVTPNVNKNGKVPEYQIVYEWSQSVAYGIRRYTRGATLVQHVDNIPTHIISAILQIDQKVNEDWPLTIVDHKGKTMYQFYHLAILGRDNSFTSSKVASKGIENFL